MNTAVEQEHIAINPCRIRGAGRSASRHAIRPATVAEVSAIAEAMPERYRMMVHLAAWCALRFGELTELRRKDIDLKRGVVRVRRAVTWPGGQPEVGTPKSVAGIRDITIPPHLIPQLRQHIEAHAQRGADGLYFRTLVGSTCITAASTRSTNLREPTPIDLTSAGTISAIRAPRRLRTREPPRASSWTGSDTRPQPWRCVTNMSQTTVLPRSLDDCQP